MPLEFWTDDDGEHWVSHSNCDVGDYGGSGSVGAGNIDFLNREYPDDCMIANGSYGYKQTWLRDTPANRQLLEGLNQYPCFDDQCVSDVESQWELEAWESWLRCDLMRTLPDGLREMADVIEGRDFFEEYRAAMDATNTYPVPEHNGVHVDVDRIKDAFRTAVELALINHDRAEDGLAPIH